MLSEPVGDIKDDPDEQLWGGAIDGSAHPFMMENTHEFYATNDKYAFPLWNDQRLHADTLFSGEMAETAFSNTAAYSPVTYLQFIPASIIGMMATNNLTVYILILRFANIVFLAVVMFLCIRRIPVGKWALSAIPLFPGSIAVNSCVTGDTMAFASTTAFVTALLLALRDPSRISRSVWTTLAVSGMAVGLTKMAYLPVVLLPLALIPAAPPRNRKGTAIASVGIVAASSLAFLGWYMLIRRINIGILHSRKTSPSEQIAYIMQHPLRYAGMLAKDALRQDYIMLGQNGLFDMENRIGLHTSGWITVLLLLAALMARSGREVRELCALRRHGLLVRTAFALAFLSCFLLIETADYLQFTPVGAPEIEGVQSRYFLPLLIIVIVILLLAIFGGEDAQTPTDEGRYRSLARVVALLQTASSAVYVLTVVLTVFR